MQTTLYSVTEAAELLQLSPRQVRARIADGILPAQRIGARAYVIAADDLARQPIGSCQGQRLPRIGDEPE